MTAGWVSRLWIFILDCPFGPRFRGLWKAEKIDFPQIVRYHCKTSSKGILSSNFCFWGTMAPKNSFYTVRELQKAI